jgi:quercetin dioxygenase-like cupin family protein
MDSGFSNYSSTARLSGRLQRLGGPIEEIRPGDVVWFPPGEKHWHGAAPTTAMTHIAIQEQLDGKAGFLFLAKTSPLL